MNYLEAITKNGYILSVLSEDKITKEKCWAAVKQDGYCLKFVPKKFITYDLCLTAIKQSAAALDIIPDEYKTEEVLIEYVNHDWRKIFKRDFSSKILLAASKNVYNHDKYDFLLYIKEDFDFTEHSEEWSEFIINGECCNKNLLKGFTKLPQQVLDYLKINEL